MMRPVLNYRLQICWHFLRKLVGAVVEFWTPLGVPTQLQDDTSFGGFETKVLARRTRAQRFQIELASLAGCRWVVVVALLTIRMWFPIS